MSIGRLEFRETIDSPWSSTTPIRAGDAASLGSPTVCVLAEDDGSPRLRIDVYEREAAAYVFQEAIAWAEFDRNGSIVWQSTELGVDGVVVSGVADGVIEGEGEWDPPGGWRRFRILLSSGTLAPP